MHRPKYDHSRAESVLGIEFTPISKSIVDMAHALEKLGVVSSAQAWTSILHFFLAGWIWTLSLLTDLYFPLTWGAAIDIVINWLGHPPTSALAMRVHRSAISRIVFCFTWLLASFYWWCCIQTNKMKQIRLLQTSNFSSRQKPRNCCRIPGVSNFPVRRPQLQDGNQTWL